MSSRLPMWEQLAMDWMQKYSIAETDLHKILYILAKSGTILPVVFAGALRSIPGYDPKKAVMLENQKFGSDGFPTNEQGGSRG